MAQDTVDASIKCKSVDKVPTIEALNSELTNCAHSKVTGRKVLKSLINRLRLRRSASAEISKPDPTYKVAYLGNVVTGWAKGDGCVEKPLATLWRNYIQSSRPDVRMQLSVSGGGLKATTKDHGLTEYWAHRLTCCAAPTHFPRLFCWVYRHEGRRLRHELRCHAVLCSSSAVARQLEAQLKQSLALALAEFKKDKISRQNARLSLVNSLYENPTIPRRKILLSTGSHNYRPPLERSKSAPKLTMIEENLEEEEEIFEGRPRNFIGPLFLRHDSVGSLISKRNSLIQTLNERKNSVPEEHFIGGSFSRANLNRGNLSKGRETFNRDNFNRENFNRDNFSRENCNRNNLNGENYNNENYKDNYSKVAEISRRGAETRGLETRGLETREVDMREVNMRGVERIQSARGIERIQSARGVERSQSAKVKFNDNYDLSIEEVQELEDAFNTDSIESCNVNGWFRSISEAQDVVPGDSDDGSLSSGCESASTVASDMDQPPFSTILEDDEENGAETADNVKTDGVSKETKKTELDFKVGGCVLSHIKGFERLSNRNIRKFCGVKSLNNNNVIDGDEVSLVPLGESESDFSSLKVFKKRSNSETGVTNLCNFERSDYCNNNNEDDEEENGSACSDESGYDEVIDCASSVGNIVLV